MTMNVYVVIDTNIMVSALYTSNEQAATSRLIQALLDDEFKTLYNDEIISEFREVMHREKFNFDKELVDALIDQVINHGFPVNRVDSKETFPDSSDAVFYEVALSKVGSFVVTGNKKHFPNSPIVVSPAEFLNILQL